MRKHHISIRHRKHSECILLLHRSCLPLLARTSYFHRKTIKLIEKGSSYRKLSSWLKHKEKTSIHQCKVLSKATNLQIEASLQRRALQKNKVPERTSPFRCKEWSAAAQITNVKEVHERCERWPHANNRTQKGLGHATMQKLLVFWLTAKQPQGGGNIKWV